MFLEEFMDTDAGQKISKLAMGSATFSAFYKYWRDSLFERVMRLFVWENTGNVKPKEIEQRLLLAGHCGVIDFKGEVTPMYGTFYGVTKYLDEWTNYIVRCPIFSESRKIGENVVVIDNNSLRNPVYPLVHHYAIMLAHTEVTIVDSLVNARDAGGVPVASTEKQKKSIAEYQGKLYNGQYGVVTDIGNLGLQYLGSDRKTAQQLIEVIEIREKLIKSFYSDIGVRSAFEKRNNTVTAEVEADTSLLLLNLSDMLKAREVGAESVNNMFGTNWKVSLAKEISYGEENERVAFDTMTEMHLLEEGDEYIENSK